MKKFYTLALAAAIAFTASAREMQQIELNNAVKSAKLTNTVAKESKRVVSMRKVADAKSVSPAKAPSRAGIDPESINGTWEFIVGDFYYQNSALDYITVQYEAEYDDGDVWFESATEPLFLAALDAATGTLTFEPAAIAYLNQARTQVLAQFPFIYNWDAGEDEDPFDYGTYTAVYDAEAGTIEFPEDFGIDWPIFDGSLTNILNYYGTYDFVYGEKAPEEEQEELDEVQEGKWENVGTAQFQDAWIHPAYQSAGVTLNPADYVYEVELQRDVNNPNRFRLWKPFQTDNFKLLAQNKSTYDGQIVFDITHPESVIVEPGMPAGFKNSNGEFYMFNLLGWQIHGYGDAYDESKYLQSILDFMNKNGQSIDTFDAATSTVTINKAVFDISPACTKAYSWQDNPYTTSTITLPKETDIKVIVTDQDNSAPVEYYNLEGIRVNSAIPGQLIIRRQGDNVSKIIVR